MMRRGRGRRAYPMGEFFVSSTKSSKLHELRIARDIGGRRVHAEGDPSISRWDKADAENGILVVDGKQTDRRQYALSEKTLGKIDGEAFSSGKIPVLAIEFTGMRFGVHRKWAVLPYESLVRLVRLASGVKNG